MLIKPSFHLQVGLTNYSIQLPVSFPFAYAGTLDVLRLPLIRGDGLWIQNFYAPKISVSD